MEIPLDILEIVVSFLVVPQMKLLDWIPNKCSHLFKCDITTLQSIRISYFENMNAKKRYNNNNDIYSITNKNLKKIYKKFNIKKLTVKKDVIADTFNVFNNIVYRNALIIELYQYVIAAIGVTDKSVSFIDINSIAAENKAHIEKIKDVYRKLFEYLYHTSQIINPLNTTFEIIDAANGMKNIKKLIAKYDTQPIDQFIYGEDVEIQKPSAYINEEENDGDDENYDYDDNDEENYDIVDGDGNLPDDDYEPEPDISLDEEYADEVILDEIVEI